MQSLNRCPTATWWNNPPFTVWWAESNVSQGYYVVR